MIHITVKITTGICIMSIFLFTRPSISFCSDNPRQELIQEKSTEVHGIKVKIHSKNTFGKITTQDESMVTIGDTRFSNNDSNSVTMQTKNDTGNVTTKGNAHVTIGTVDISGVKNGQISVFTQNTVNGTITAQQHSSAAMGTVNVH